MGGNLTLLATIIMAKKICFLCMVKTFRLEPS